MAIFSSGNYNMSGSNNRRSFSTGSSGGNSGGSGGSGGWWIVILIAAVIGGGGFKLMDNLQSRDATVGDVKSEISSEQKSSEDSESKGDDSNAKSSDDVSSESSDDVSSESNEDSSQKLSIDSNGNVKVADGVITEYNLPKYNGKNRIITINNIDGEHQQTAFTNEDLNMPVGTTFSDLDYMGRVGVANGMLDKSTLPTVDREDTQSISNVKPTGWVNKRVTSAGKSIWLYNRSHLIAFSLSGETANKRNLMTGTRWFNMPGMTTFETIVRNYIKKTGKKVRYRVAPVFNGSDKVAQGVQMQGYSVEDHGKSVSFNVFIYNVQDDVKINYADGTSKN